jgi:hypothetical protein
MALLSATQRTALRQALDRYDGSGFYDETFTEVSNRIRQAGCATKLDISALAFWKRLRANTQWAKLLLMVSDDVVKSATRAAFADGLSDSERLDTLAVLPGFKSKGAVATTLLAAWDPHRYGVMDRRSLSWLHKESLLPKSASTPAYLETLVHLRDELDDPARRWDARDVDKSLYELGGA